MHIIFNEFPFCSQGSDLGPGRYSFDSFTDQMSKKVTSLRGPYDLFTGDRNKPIRTGHFAAPVSLCLLLYTNTVESLLRGHSDKRPTLLESPNDIAYLIKIVFISTPDERPHF